MSLLLLPLCAVLALPDAIVRLLALLGVEQEGVFAVFGTSGPVGVAVGLAVAHWRRQLGLLYARVSIAPIEFIYEKLDRISSG